VHTGSGAAVVEEASKLRELMEDTIVVGATVEADVLLEIVVVEEPTKLEGVGTLDELEEVEYEELDGLIELDKVEYKEVEELDGPLEALDQDDEL
jgi:hypothetical protein